MTSVSYGCTSGLGGVEGTSVAKRRVRMIVAGRGRAAAALGAPALGGMAYSDALKAARRSIERCRVFATSSRERQRANSTSSLSLLHLTQLHKLTAGLAVSCAQVFVPMLRLPAYRRTFRPSSSARLEHPLQKFRLALARPLGRR
jgi:hypothetical protein